MIGFFDGVLLALRSRSFVEAGENVERHFDDCLLSREHSLDRQAGKNREPCGQQNHADADQFICHPRSIAHANG